MKNLVASLVLCFLSSPLLSQDSANWISSLPQPKDYVQHRASSYDRSGANVDARRIAPGETFTLLDEAGPGLITHLWVTIASDDPQSLEGAGVANVLGRGECSQCRGADWGFFWAGAGGLSPITSRMPLSVGSDKALNCFMPMPFQKHARITVTNEGSIKTDAFYFNIDYRAYGKPLPSDQLYLHAQYRQETPAKDGAISGGRMDQR